MAEIEQKAGKEKNTLKKMIIIVSVVILLAGAGAVAFFLLKGDSKKAEKVAQDSPEDIAVEKIYYDMGKSFIINFPEDSSIRVAQISVTFMVADEETVEALKKHEPMIRNNILMMINARGADNLKTREGKEQLRTAMLNEVTAILKKMAGNSQVKEVFFTSFVMQ